MGAMAMEKTFRQWKKQCLNKLDPSKKGSVDEDIVHVVSLLNSCEEYFTTSSCSGRVMLIDGAPESSDVHKQNCVWLFVSHRKCQSEDLGGSNVCLVPLALSGHRLWLQELWSHCEQDRKMITAVRSTHGLEVPLSHEGKLLVEQEYIHFLTRIANQKAEENQRRIHRFYQNLQSALTTVKLQIPNPPVSPKPQEARLETERGEEEQKEEEEKKTSVYKRRWKREQHHRADRRHGDRSSLVPDLDDCRHGDRSSLVPDLDDCLDLFT